MNDSIDAAWTDVEAALPEYWYIRSFHRMPPHGDSWEVVAADGRKLILGKGSTPAEALRDLAERAKSLPGWPRA